MACGIFPDQGSNLCPLHWQEGSYPLDHQGSPLRDLDFSFFGCISKVELLDHIVVLLLVFLRSSILFSIGVAPIYIPTKSI